MVLWPRDKEVADIAMAVALQGPQRITDTRYVSAMRISYGWLINTGFF